MQFNVLLGCGIGPSASPSDPLRPAWPFISPEHDYVPISPDNTDGLIIAAPLHSQARSKYIKEVMAAGHPIIFIGSGESGHSVIADNKNGILTALKHLKDHGHKKIAFIAGSPEDIQGDTGERLRAYQLGCQLYDLDQDANLLVFGQHVFDGGYLAANELLGKGVDFSAILASNDESALGAIKALKEAGKSIPQEVAIIGFDNRLEDDVSEPGLTSIHVPLFSMGYQAAKLLINHITSNIELELITYVPTRLVVRESCGCKSLDVSDKKSSSSRIIQSEIGKKYPSHLIESISVSVSNHALNLTEEKCLSFSRELVTSFIDSSIVGESQKFIRKFHAIVQETSAFNDDPYIWSIALSLLEIWSKSNQIAPTSSPAYPEQMISESRLIISRQMKHYYNLHEVDERWIASRISLLTSKLLTALDEPQIFEALSTYLPEINISKAWIVLVDPESQSNFDSFTLRNLTNKTSEPFQIKSSQFPPPEIFHKDMATQLTLVPLVNPSGQIGFMIFEADQLDLYGAIAQQLSGALNTAKLYHQTLEGLRLAEEVNQMKNRFLSMISHELRTPINLILGISRIMMSESENEKVIMSESIIKDIERIHSYAQHLGGMIGDVIDLATNDAGKLRLNMEVIDLSETLQLVVDSGSALTYDKGLTWKASLPEKGPWIWGDRTRLRQIVLNLINNAIKFTTYGTVSLSVEVIDNTVIVKVCDTGIGIPPKEQSVIFNEFYRSERSIALGYPGLGLGLSVCKLLVELHDGKIGLQSSGVQGEGSCFYFSLPILEAPSNLKLKYSDFSVIKQHVLILTSYQNKIEQLENLLVTRGIDVQVILMEEVTEWLKYMAISPPDAIILDVSIQSDLGWSALREIKSSQMGRGIPIMFYSSTASGEGIFDLDYLTKPIELAELTQAFDTVRLMLDTSKLDQTVLVVDDDVDTLNLHSRIVESQSSSFRVLKAKDGIQALRILKEDLVDIVMLDLQMPQMDGFGVLEAMRNNQRLREIPVIVITGKVLTQEEMARLNQGVTSVLNKGLFSSNEIISHINQALQRKKEISKDAQRLVRQAMVFVHDHYTEQISRVNIANHVNISEDYLTFCFRKELGITPIKYLRRHRIKQAKILLKASQISITEIAFSVGFSDSSYFSRIFHQETGVSPEEFRQTS